MWTVEAGIGLVLGAPLGWLAGIMVGGFVGGMQGRNTVPVGFGILGAIVGSLVVASKLAKNPAFTRLWRRSRKNQP